MCIVDKYGFPNSYRSNKRQYFGLRTGDLVKAVVLKGKFIGTWISRGTVRSNGRVVLSVNNLRFSVHHNKCIRLFGADGYSYNARVI